MPNIYCPDCGKPNQYSDLKPGFCGFCQSALDVNAAPRSQTVASRKKEQRGRGRVAVGRRSIYEDDEEDDDRDFDGTLPDIRKLDMEIEMPQPVQREKVGEVWGSGALGDIRDKPKVVSKEQALQQLKDRIFKKTEIDLNPNG